MITDISHALTVRLGKECPMPVFLSTNCELTSYYVGKLAPLSSMTGLWLEKFAATWVCGAASRSSSRPALCRTPNPGHGPTSHAATWIPCPTTKTSSPTADRRFTRAFVNRRPWLTDCCHCLRQKAGPLRRNQVPLATPATIRLSIPPGGA